MRWRHSPLASRRYRKKYVSQSLRYFAYAKTLSNFDKGVLIIFFSTPVRERATERGGLKGLRRVWGASRESPGEGGNKKARGKITVHTTVNIQW